VGAARELHERESGVGAGAAQARSRAGAGAAQAPEQHGDQVLLGKMADSPSWLPNG